MKIEEITEKKESRNSFLRWGKNEPVKTKNSNHNNYWFPLNRGYNRLLCVLWILSSIIVTGGVADESEAPSIFFVILIVEFILYLAAIWVYQGFKDNPKKTDDEKKL